MTNKEKYQQAFSALQPTQDIRLEEKTMKTYHKRQVKRTIAMVAVICLAVCAGGGGAYAANIGGIQRTIQLWLHGDQTTATVDINDDGTYTVKIPDENGEQQTAVSGGGKAFDAFGNEVPLSEEEIMEQVTAPNVEYYDDGSIWFFYKDMAKDITDSFDENEVCYIKATDDEGDLYVTVKKYAGYAYSRDKYTNPKTFNTDARDPDGIAYQPASEKPDAESGGKIE